MNDKLLTNKIAGKHNKATWLFAAVAGVSLGAALIIGVSGNVTGLALCYIAAGSVILSFAHRWRKAWCFVILLTSSALGFVLGVLLHNFLYALSQMAADIPGLKQALELLHVVFFLFAILICPAGLLVGAVGTAWVCLKTALADTTRHRKTTCILVAISCVALIIALFVFMARLLG